jgi:hypothetical protein
MRYNYIMQPGNEVYTEEDYATADEVEIGDDY